MDKPAVFITRLIHEPALEKIRAVAEVEVWPFDSPPPRSILIDRAGRMDGLLTLLTDPIDTEVIAAAHGKLKVISQMAVGFDNIDVKTANAQRIPVGNTPGVLTETTADMAWALIMATARRIPEADRQVRQGIWHPWGPFVLTGTDVSGATLGIIGMGRIGQAVARRARGFDMRILYTDLKRNPEAEQQLGAHFVTLGQLLAESDFVSLHSYLSAENYHMIGRQQLAMMKPGAILINTARGGLVDPQALTEALRNGPIGAAGLDVFEPEPIPQDHPLLAMDNVVIAPHIASASKQTRLRMALMAADNLIAGLQGKRLPFCVNPEVYEVSGPR
ncbi:lactate dehydrogenase [Longilinea arvoryzae]|uniref:Lactate dehydrogenase n=1 Tax=Longilinea arvoryzae TaxID=360412 RepID=A0A0S7BI48_9CHLR|nr:D-glycerate dehydrogenase [Longilinea arvoryzae]GAP14848.1 lactate dehydrogenase [Longilinea arvoryzae]